MADQPENKSHKHHSPLDPARHSPRNYLIRQHWPAKVTAQAAKGAKRAAEPPSASTSLFSKRGHHLGSSSTGPAQARQAGRSDSHAKTHAVETTPWWYLPKAPQLHSPQTCSSRRKPPASSFAVN